jgi:hypothetical protein
MSLQPCKVNKQTALNPVARAMAWANMVKSATTAKIKLYMTDEGENCANLLLKLADYFALVLLACEEEQRTDELQQAVNAGQLVILEISGSGWLWHKKHLQVMDDALDATALLAKALKPQSINKASRRFAQVRKALS